MIPKRVSTRKVEIEVGVVKAMVTFKKVKNLRVSIHPPMGDVRVSAPTRVPLKVIRTFVEERLDWIVQNQQVIRSRPVPPEPEFKSGENLFVWGQSYPIVLREVPGKPRVLLSDIECLLTVRPGSTVAQREKVIHKWQKELLSEAIESLLAEWEPQMKVKSAGYSLRRMKTRWGSCNTRARTIRFNTELVKRPIECLEHVVVHELVHLLERSHNARFKGFMDHFLPNWRATNKLLNKRLESDSPGSQMADGVD